jgi:hypothetical protein
MTEAEKKILESSLSKLFKLDKEALSSLYNEDGELTTFDPVIAANETKIASMKEEKDNQYKRGLKDGATKFEKHIKDKYQVDAEVDGTDLVDALVDKKIAETSTLTDDQVEKHPKFIELKTETDKKIKEAVKVKEAEFEKEKAEYARKETLQSVRGKAISILDGLNPILPEDQNKAKSWKETYLREFEQFDYQPKDDDFVVLKDGKVYEDAHGNTVKLSELAKNTADKYFDYKKAEDRSGSGNKEGGEKKVTFKDRDDYTRQVKEAKGDVGKQRELATAAAEQGLV